jgi:hypothetical protein
MSIPEPKVEHHEGRGIRSCPIFPELRSIFDEAFEIFRDKSEYVVAAPQYRAAANTAMGWKNANLRSEMLRLLRRAGIPGWPRLFHSMRASRQTELQREFPIHVVCSWLGNSPRIAQQSYLLVTEDDFAKAAVAKKVEPPSSPHKTQYHSTNHEVVYVVNECSLKRTVSMISPKSSCAQEHNPIQIDCPLMATRLPCASP